MLVEQLSERLEKYFTSPILEPVQAYDIVAKQYDQWHWQEFWHANEVPIVTRLAEHYRITPRRCVDLGCGSGTYCLALRDLFDVYGVDPSPRMLEQATTKLGCNVPLLLGSATNIPLPSGWAQLVVTARSLCHEPSLQAGIREVGRVTEEGGVWILSDVHSEHPYPCTRIPLRGAPDVYVKTFKRNPSEIIDAAIRSGLWSCESTTNFSWTDLLWAPTSKLFARIDRGNARPVFFISVLKRTTVNSPS